MKKITVDAKADGTREDLIKGEMSERTRAVLGDLEAVADVHGTLGDLHEEKLLHAAKDEIINLAAELHDVKIIAEYYRTEAEKQARRARVLRKRAKGGMRIDRKRSVSIHRPQEGAFQGKGAPSGV